MVGSVVVFTARGREAFPGPTQAARIAGVFSGRPVLEGARTGYAAAVHGALRTVDTPARRRSAWERRRDRLHREQQELRTQMSAQSRYLTSKLGLGCGAGFCLCIGLVPFMLGTAEMFGLLVTGVALLLLGVACAPGLVAVSVQQSDRQGDSRTRAHSVQQYYDLPKIWPPLNSGIQLIHEDLRRAEQICARTEQP